MNKVIRKVETLKKDQADSLAADLLQPIFNPNSQPHFAFKLCQVCSIINSKKLQSFEVSFKKFEDEIEEFIRAEKNAFFSTTINGLLFNLLNTPSQQSLMHS
jgi:hypothetical protein